MWTIGDTATVAVVIVLFGLLVGLLVAFLAGWKPGERARRVVSGIGRLSMAGVMAGVGAALLLHWLGFQIEPRPIYPSMLSLLLGIGFVALVVIVERRGPEALIGRIVFTFVVLLAAVLSVSELLPVADPELQRALRLASGVGFVLLMVGFVFSDIRTTYGAGLLVVTTSLVVTFLLAIPLFQSPITSPVVFGLSPFDLVVLLGFLIGLAMTLYGNLWHPGQWLAAGAGAVLAGVAFVLPGRESWLLLALPTLLFAPRLIGAWVTSARARRQDSAGA